MNTVTQEYQTLVLDDLQSYAGLTHPVKAGFLERLLRRELPLDELHPNPDDEFCDPAIGPSYDIVSRYLEDWRRYRKYSQKPELDRLCVAKMSVGGYMILDGHHRWLAAHRLGFSKFPVQIMNVTPVAQILSSIAASDRTVCASFDLDEVLLTDPAPLYAGKKLPAPFLSFLKTSMRKYAPDLIRELQALGIDVWVYTGSFMSEEKLQHIFRYHHCRPDGIVNGLRNKAEREQLRKAFSGKYAVSLHIDASGIICVNTRSREYEEIAIPADENTWASSALAAVRKIPMVQEHLQPGSGK